MTPSFLSTVTPGKLPTCWLEPVSWLNSVVLPEFWFACQCKYHQPRAPLACGASPSVMFCASSRRRGKLIAAQVQLKWGPHGAILRTITVVPGVRPISSSLRRSAPSPPTAAMRSFAQREAVPVSYFLPSLLSVPAPLCRLAGRGVPHGVSDSNNPFFSLRAAGQGVKRKGRGFAAFLSKKRRKRPPAGSCAAMPLI